MITKDNAWVYPEAYGKANQDAEQAEKDGFVKVPDWFPAPTKGYEYKIFGQMLTYMKPKPKRRHVLRFAGHRFRAWRFERKAKKMFR